MQRMDGKSTLCTNAVMHLMLLLWYYVTSWVSISSMPGLTPAAFEDLRYVAINSIYIPKTEYALSLLGGFGFFFF